MSVVASRNGRSVHVLAAIETNDGDSRGRVGGVECRKQLYRVRLSWLARVPRVLFVGGWVGVRVIEGRSGERSVWLFVCLK